MDYQRLFEDAFSITSMRLSFINICLFVGYNTYFPLKVDDKTFFDAIFLMNPLDIEQKPTISVRGYF